MAKSNGGVGEPDGLSVADLLDCPSDWSDWMSEHDFPPLAQLRLAALLLRELSVVTLVNRLAPALIAVDAAGQEMLAKEFDDPAASGETVPGFEDWLAAWDDGDGAPYTTAVIDVLQQLATTPDLRHFADVVQEPSMDGTVLLWFLLKGIRRWVWGDGQRDDLAEDARWLFDLLFSERVTRDPLATLFAFLYERHRRGHGSRWLPLEDDIALKHDHDLHFDASHPLTVSQDLILHLAASPVFEPAPRLSNLLSFDPRAWPEAATGIANLRRSGLLSATGFAATPLGKKWTASAQRRPANGRGRAN